MTDAGMRTRFFELQGAEALSRLRPLADALAQAGARVTLLSSRDRPDLYLLVAESPPDALPNAAAPEGCKVWTFERVAI